MVNAQEEVSIQEEAIALENAMYSNSYVVILETSNDYFALRKKMFNLSKELNIEIDTMDRGFDRKEKIISLPENYEDIIYAGFYYPRRFNSETLSLEYLNYYKDDSKFLEGPMALVTMITSDKKEAEERLKSIKMYEKKAFILQARIYIACMH